MDYKILSDGRIYPDRHPINWDLWMMEHHVKLKGDKSHEKNINERNESRSSKSVQRSYVAYAGGSND